MVVKSKDKKNVPFSKKGTEMKFGTKMKIYILRFFFSIKTFS